MALRVKGFWLAAFAVSSGLAVALSAQAPTRPPQAPAPSTPTPDQPTFRVSVDAVTQDVVVKDDHGNFVPNLTKDDFEVYEDGVKQDIVTMTMVFGGRVKDLLNAPPPAAPEGLILPPVHKVNDTSGRIFLFFVDDLNLQFQNSGRVRDLFKRVAKNLVHDGDLFGIVSSGPSSISIDLTYDKKRLDEAISKMTGDGLKPSDIINSSSGAQGPAEIRYRAQVAFSTMTDALTNLDKVHDRRKALVWVSEGYDFAPFQNSRLGLLDPNTGFLQNQSMAAENAAIQQNNSDNGVSCSGCDDPSRDPSVIAQKQSEEFADADLIRQLADITAAANRSNTTIYTIDPRGLIAGSDIDQQVDPQEWNKYVSTTQNSMRVLADETGGIAVVNMNDFDKALRRIDADTSDYYVLGYYSNDPDIRRRRRTIDVRVLKKGLSITAARKDYVLKAPSKPAKPVPPPPAAKPKA